MGRDGTRRAPGAEGAGTAAGGRAGAATVATTAAAGAAGARAGAGTVATAAVVAAGAAAATAWLVQSAPAVTTFGPARNRLLPGLAGVGAPDHVALTFDDGPDPASTPAFLEVLAELDIRATFFLLGEMVVRAPELAREMVAAGHELAVHGWDHRPMILRGPRSTHDGLARTATLIEDVTGQRPSWARPPNGIMSTAFAVSSRRLGLRPVLWTGWGEDWTAQATPRTVLATLAPQVRGGATLLLHDSDRTSAPGAWRSALGALPELYARCHDGGLRLGRLDEHGVPAGRRSPHPPPQVGGYSEYEGKLP